MECNGPLEPAEKEGIRYSVPAHVFDTHQEFRRCSGCSRVYWRGSHCEAVDAALAELF
jgi:uncharacterized protein with PIN domain